MQGCNKTLFTTGTILAALCVLWYLVPVQPMFFKPWLLSLKEYCFIHPFTGYFVYAMLLGAILVLGLPIATALMFFAGIIYNFWEAIALVTLCRFAIAMGAFSTLRYTCKPVKQKRHAPYLVRLFERHPTFGLLLARLAPIPDSVVSYTVASTPIRHVDYMWATLVGMVPLSVFCVWLGSELGSVSSLLHFLQ